MNTAKRVLTAVAATLALGAPVLILSAESASAAARNGVCDSGEFCYYYNSGEAGAVSDFTNSVSNYGDTEPSCYDFKGSAAGAGTCIKNNAASVWNRSSQTVRVYFNSGYGGSYQDFAPGASGNLNATLKNNDASHLFLASAGGSGEAPVNDYDHSTRGFAVDNCTAFAAYRIATRTGDTNFSNSFGGVTWGNANNWANAARAVGGITVNTTPTVGAIAVNTIHGLYGHVAYVYQVNSDGSFDVEEYNWNVTHGYGTRTNLHVGSSADFQWMLHF